MTPFDHALELTLGLEGGYSNHLMDRGGETMCGITEAVARRHGWEGEMRDPPIEMVRHIYKVDYWDPLMGDYLGEDNPELAEELFDTAVNCGVGFASKILQKSINVLNRNRTADIMEDGQIGPQTLQALRNLARRDFDYLLECCKILQGNHYISLAHRDPTRRIFIRGWLTRV